MESSLNVRIEKVLDKLIDPNFNLKNDSYLNLLLTHLTTKVTDNDAEAGQDRSIRQFLLDWCSNVTTKWAETKEIPKPEVLAFTMNLLSTLCSTEKIFIELKNANIFESLLHLSTSSMASPPQPNVELALVKLLLSFTDHETGWEWMMTANHWKIILNSALNAHTVYISKEGCKCIAKLLVVAGLKYGTLCKAIIQFILTPLIEASNKLTTNDLLAKTNDALDKSSAPHLQLVVEMLLKSLENQVRSNEKEYIWMVAEECGLEKCVQKLISQTENEDSIHNLYKILIILCFFDMHFKSHKKKIIRCGEIDMTVKLFEVLYDAVSKGPVKTVYKIILSSLDYWKIMEETSPVWLSPKLIDLSFEDQLMILQILPATSFNIKKIRSCLEKLEEQDECRTRFMQKFVDRIAPATLRIFYKWRDYLYHNDSFSQGTVALKYFLHSKKYYKRDNAIFAFGCFTRTLVDITFCMENYPDLIPFFLSEPEYLALLLETITIIIEDFGITWKDSSDTFCILKVVYHFLEKFTLPPRVVVKGLKLADEALSRYMSPHLALLIDKIDCTTIIPLASLLYVKLHDGEWEIRDSSIELICTLIKTASTEFSSLRKPVSENDFPCVILNMASVDGNSFVRATALKCLQEMIKIDEFWEALSTKGNILEKSLEILHMETEGIVRTEAAVLVHCMYRHQNIPESMLDKFYDVMTHAVVADLHWEVRVKALHFWKSVIDHHLTQQGMIDGTFPSVTFSKEHRKIVNLSEAQIKKGLHQVLRQLSLNGALAVFHSALQDQCDIQVRKYATNTIRDFVALLKKYSVAPEVPPATAASKKPLRNDTSGSMASSCSRSETGPSSVDDILPSRISCDDVGDLDKLLEEILDSQDINLLQSVFNSLDQPTHDYIQMKGRTVLSPSEFVNFVYSNFEFCTNERVEWVEVIDSFSSLLDDILKDYDKDDVNSMDCY
nr:uncharacterized protein LOC111511923 [Leptinotarsa decemlineata]